MNKKCPKKMCTNQYQVAHQELRSFTRKNGNWDAFYPQITTKISLWILKASKLFCKLLKKNPSGCETVILYYTTIRTKHNH